MLQKHNSLFLVSTLSAVVIGSICGYYFPEFMRSISFIGKIYFHGLKIIIIPFVVSIIIVGIASMGSTKKVYRSLSKSIVYFLATSLIAVLIGYLITFIAQPGYLVTSESAQIPQELASELSSFSFTRLLSTLLPANIATSIGSGQIVGLVMITIFFAVALLHVGNKSKSVLDFFTTFSEIMKKMVVAFLYLTPIAIFSLIGTSIANHLFVTKHLLDLMMAYSITMLIGFFVFGFIILPIILKLFGNKPIFSYFKQLIPSASIAFSSGSVVAALPITYENVVERNNVDNRAGSFVLPLASVFNMNGTAIYLSIAAIFIAQFFNISLSPMQFILLTVGCIGVSFFSSLIPYASLLMLGLVLNFADFPLHALAGIGLLLTVDWLFERLRAVVNLLGDAVGAAVIGDTFDFKTAKIKQPKTPFKPTARKGRRLPERKKSVPTKKDSRQKGSGRFTEKPKPEKVRKKKIEKPVKKTIKPKKKSAVKRKSSSKVELPPAPFHLLETELKPKENDEIKDENTTKEITVNGASLPDETIERERAKVAAQLAKIRDKEIISEKNSTESNKVENQENGFSKIDFYSEDSQSAEQPKEPTPDVQPDVSDIEATEIADDEKKESEIVTYGRGKSKRDSSSKTESSDKKDDTDEESAKAEETEKPAYDTENVTFGRTKRKK
jgi:Na+/H+-dicarboxylate symporter